MANLGTPLLRLKEMQRRSTHPLAISDMAKIIAVLESAQSFVDECPVDDNDRPHASEFCGNTEFVKLVDALNVLQIDQQAEPLHAR